jgi:protein phosphatase-4 regulatory subunit 3
MIIKAIIMMNDMQLIEDLMQEDTFWDVVGCLEYDPELGANKANHRHFLKVCSLRALRLLPEKRSMLPREI